MPPGIYSGVDTCGSQKKRGRVYWLCCRYLKNKKYAFINRLLIGRACRIEVRRRGWFKRIAPNLSISLCPRHFLERHWNLAQIFCEPLPTGYRFFLFVFVFRQIPGTSTYFFLNIYIYLDVRRPKYPGEKEKKKSSAAWQGLIEHVYTLLILIWSISEERRGHLTLYSAENV